MALLQKIRYNLDHISLLINRQGKGNMVSHELAIDRIRLLINAWEPSQDRRSIFLNCYIMMTENMMAALAAEDFEDTAWVSDLLERFAGYYFHALDAYESDLPAIPQVWKVAFEATRLPHTHVLQNLVLGVNAHINYDLVFALLDVLSPEWNALSPQQRLMRYHDHCHVNDIISQTIDRVQDQIIDRYDPEYRVIDTLLGPLDEWMTSLLISDWREEVWKHATQLLDANETSRKEWIHRVEQIAMQRAHAILGQGGIGDVVELI